MGGFGAILLSRLAPIDTVISFVPQFSVDPRIVPEETRWKDYTSLIESYLYPDLSDAFVKHTTYYVFNGLSPVEEVHFRRFPAAENVCSLLFPAESHGVARMLKQYGMLKAVIDLCVDGTIEDVSALMRTRYGAVRLPESRQCRGA